MDPLPREWVPTSPVLGDKILSAPTFPGGSRPWVGGSGEAGAPPMRLHSHLKLVVMSATLQPRLFTPPGSAAPGLPLTGLALLPSVPTHSSAGDQLQGEGGRDVLEQKKLMYSLSPHALFICTVLFMDIIVGLVHWNPEETDISIFFLPSPTHPLGGGAQG